MLSGTTMFPVSSGLVGRSQLPVASTSISAPAATYVYSQDAKISGEISDLQANLLKEQMSNLSRELTILRQDITTLRLADSQFEIQVADLSRQIRDVQENLKADVQNDAARIQSLEMSYVNTTTEAKKDRKQLGDLEERIVRDLSLVNDRVTEVARDLAAVKEKPAVVKEPPSNRFEGIMQDLLGRMLAQEKLNREAHDLIARLTTEFGNHKSTTDDLHKSTRELIIQERGAREKSHGGTQERLTDMERKLREAMMESSGHRDKATTTMVEALERKVFNELGRAYSDHDSKLERLKGDHANHASDLGNLQSKMATEMKRMSDDYKSGLDEHGKKHQSAIDMLNSMNNDHHGKHSDNMRQTTSQIRDLEKRLRDGLSDHASTHDTKHAAVSGGLADLERKLREEFTGKMSGGPKQGAEQSGNPTNAWYGELAEIKEKFNKHSSTHKGLIDDHKNDHRKALQDFDTRLQTQHGSLKDEMRNHIVELLARERAEREAGDNGLLKRVEDIDAKLKEGIARVASDNDNNHSALKDALANVDRKFRDELQGLDSKHRGNHADLKEFLTKGLADHGHKHGELKDLIAVVSQEEQKARDGHKKDLASNLELVEKRLRQELAGVDSKHGGLHDHIGQERQLRESAHSTLIDRLGDMERKIGGSNSGGNLDTSLAEMREIVLNACFKECSQMQETIKQNQGFVSTQFADINKILLEEKNLRTRDKLELQALVRQISIQVRNHTHEAQVTQVAQVPQVQQVATTQMAAVPQVRSRCVSPTPVQQRCVSPMQASTIIGTTAVMPQQTLVQSPSATQVLTSPALPIGTSSYVSSPTMAVRPAMEMYGTTQYVSSPTMMDFGSTTTQYIASPSASVVAPPMAMASIDTTGDNFTNFFVMGEDRNLDGIPDVLQQGLGHGHGHGHGDGHSHSHDHDHGVGTGDRRQLWKS